jgi:hypothetical protein
MQRTPANSTSSADGALDGSGENGFRRKVQRANEFAVSESARGVISPGRDCIGGTNTDPAERPHRSVDGMPGRLHPPRSRRQAIRGSGVQLARDEFLAHAVPDSWRQAASPDASQQSLSVNEVEHVCSGSAVPLDFSPSPCFL